MSRAKYRPYFSLSELQLLNRCLQKQMPIERGLIRYLSRYIADIEYGLREPNHTLEASVEEKLGFSEQTTIHQNGAELYAQWKNNIPLSPAQISLVNQYRYENDLMNEDEESAFVSNLMESKS